MKNGIKGGTFKPSNKTEEIANTNYKKRERFVPEGSMISRLLGYLMGGEIESKLKVDDNHYILRIIKDKSGLHYVHFDNTGKIFKICEYEYIESL